MMRKLGTVQKEKVLENKGSFLDTKFWKKNVKGAISTCSRKP
jgi:hypothetical protein